MAKLRSLIERYVKLLLLRRVIRAYVRDMADFPIPLRRWVYDGGRRELYRETHLQDGNSPALERAMMCLLTLGEILKDPRLPPFGPWDWYKGPKGSINMTEGEKRDLFFDQILLYAKRLRLQDIPDDKHFWTIEQLIKEGDEPSWRVKWIK